MVEHLFCSSTDGALYDTRVPCWHRAPPLRRVYRQHYGAIRTVAELKATLRAGASTDVGGYPLYFIMNDGETLSFETARREFRQLVRAIRQRSRDGWRPVAVEINYEDAEMVCAHSGQPIPCAYGED